MEIEFFLLQSKTGWEPQSGKEYSYTVQAIVSVPGVFLPKILKFYLGYNRETAEEVLRDKEIKFSSPELLKRLESAILEEARVSLDYWEKRKEKLMASAPKIIKQKKIIT